MPKAIVLGMLILIGGASSAIFWAGGMKHLGFGKEAAPPCQARGETPVPEESPAVQAVGYVEPVSDVRNLSFKGGGILAECDVEIGKRVRAGDVLMVLNDAAERKALAVAEREQELAKAECADVLVGVNKFEIAAAQQALEVAQQRSILAEQELARGKRLVPDDAMSQSDYDKCSSDSKQTAAEARRCESELRRLQAFVTPEHKQVAEKKVSLAAAKRDQAAQIVADMRLVAPIDGTILEILRREGESVSAYNYEPVIVLADSSHLRVRAEIDERYVRVVKPGQAVTVCGRAWNGQKYRGRVALVKDLMGKRTVFTRSATEHKDLDVVQALIDMEADFTAPIGLRVDVSIDVESHAVRRDCRSPPRM